METYLFVDRDQAVPCRDVYIHCSLQYIAAFDKSRAEIKNNTADQWTLDLFFYCIYAY